MRSRPRWLGGKLPDLPSIYTPTAHITFERSEDDRGVRVVVCRTDDELSHRITDEIGQVRDLGYRVVKTELTDARGEEWSYEYDTTGQITNVYRNGEVTP